MGKLKLRNKILIFVSIIFLFSFFGKVNSLVYYPKNIKVIKGENRSLETVFPFVLSVNKEYENVVETSFNESDSNKFKKQYELTGRESGNINIQLKLLGFIPVKNYKVQVVERPELIPGGNSIGVSLNTKGVLIVAVTDLIDSNGQKQSPAREAGLKVGDSILEINQVKISDANHLVKILNENEFDEVNLLIKRNKAEFNVKLKPIKSIQDNTFRLGVWVRDKTSGIGTLTYYNKENNKFGALGHGIIDKDTGKLMPVEKGKIMNSKISKIQEGKKGIPGEIRGAFYEAKDVIGDIERNTDYGIFGSIDSEYLEDLLTKSIPIAFKEEVVEGKAKILTTIDENKIEEFDIEILKVQSQLKPDQKSMIVKITDKKLLDKTGGIVQGMSGSPIIQNEKLIGAITHVFVNDPTKGYGVYIEWMLD